MKIALVHDYLNEFGGAERVLEALAELYPEAPIYTAFQVPGSKAAVRFEERKVITSWAQRVPWFKEKLHSPLRFLAPLIWESFDFSEYDVVISSASWYITKGIITRPETLHVCYCHTPPRYLYGLPTSIQWQKYWPVRLYASLVNGNLREYDYLAAQRVDYFVANSKNVQDRIERYYRRESEVIYPPVELVDGDEEVKQGDYFLVLSRLVGGKGLDLAVEAAKRLKVPLKVVGVGGGWSKEEERLRTLGGKQVEFLGYVPDEELRGLYGGAKGFLALAEDEDFGITPVEAMMAGTLVVAFRGGGYLETVVEGKTGLFVDELTVEAVVEGMKRLLKASWDEAEIKKQAKKFSKERFMKEIGTLVEEKYKEMLG